MHLIGKYHKGVKFLLCVIDVYRKYLWVVPIEDKHDITITNVFQKILDEYGYKPNEIWID